MTSTAALKSLPAGEKRYRYAPIADTPGIERIPSGSCSGGFFFPIV